MRYFIKQGYYATSDQDPISWVPSKNLIEISAEEYDLYMSRGARMMRRHEHPGHYDPFGMEDVPEGYTLTTGRVVLDKPQPNGTIYERLGQAGFPIKNPTQYELLEHLPDMIIDIGRDGGNRVYSVSLKNSSINFTGSSLWETMAEVWILANRP